MKIVCSVASCKYSSENEDSSNVTFINFPHNYMAAAWAENCGRPDLIGKLTQDLHTEYYICSDHIEDQFFISKRNPLIIAQGAIPTIFEITKDSNNDGLDIKDNYKLKNVIGSLQLTELMNVIDVCQPESLTGCGSAYLEPAAYEKETDAVSDMHFCDTVTANSDQLLQTQSVGFENLCRLCGRSTVNGTEIFTEKGLKMGLKEKILFHTHISIDPEDAMPRRVCLDCCSKLEDTHSLVVTCLRTDTRLRRLFDTTDKVRYSCEFDRLLSACSMEMTNEMTLNNVNDGSALSKNSDKIDNSTVTSKLNCKLKEIASNIKLSQVEVGPISKPSNDSTVGLKYVLNSDLKNVLQSLRLESPKNREVNNVMSTVTSQFEVSEGTSLRNFICRNCNGLFENEKTLNSHEIICNGEHVQTNTKMNEILDCNSAEICPVCRRSFDDVELFEKHKKSCYDSLSGFNCQNCNELFDNKDDLDIHVSSHTDKVNTIRLKRRCGHCADVFITRKELQVHIANNHNDQLLFKCGICEKTYGKWSSLDVHEATHRLDKPYLCDLCGKSFKHSNNLRGHKRIHLEDSKKKRHVCEICGSAFRSRFHLREHTNQHDGNKPYTCEECGKSFYKRIQLRQHRLSHGSNKYTCPICGVSFNRRGNMNTHLKRHSKNEGMFTCSVCEYKCKSMSELKMHRKQHSETDIMESIKLKAPDKTLWQCNICEKVFPKRTIFLNHERMHTGDRMTLECDKCGKKLANKSSLKYHNMSIHSTERPHMCQFCGESFVSKEARLIHERIHTGERPYNCKICGMQYRCSSNLSQHMKIHSSLRPHVCHYCDKTFTRKGALNVHERIHTGLKPFVCDICSRSFSQKNDMLKHTKTHQTKATQCDKCDKIFDSKTEILKHLNFHEQNTSQDPIIPEYVVLTEPLESYTLGIHCQTIEEVN